MKTWKIPTKTFFLGEYLALLNGPAILITTNPCFELSLVENQATEGIHAESPAGLWWAAHSAPNFGLIWKDPYLGKGGLGASSAQFIGAYLASQFLTESAINKNDLMAAYLNQSFKGEGLKPSGYDLIAQMHFQCVYINRQQEVIETYPWPFPDLSFILIHSGQKLATHDHLKSINLPKGIENLSPAVELGRKALETSDSDKFIAAVNRYQSQLETMQLTAQNSLELIHSLKKQPDVLAAKGCGAMGADVILVLLPSNKRNALIQNLRQEGLVVLATEDQLINK